MGKVEQGPGTGNDDLDIEAPETPPARGAIIEGSTFVTPLAEAAFRMALLQRAGLDEDANHMYEALSRGEIPPPRAALRRRIPEKEEPLPGKAT